MRSTRPPFSLLAAALVCACLLAAPVAHAEKADRQKPMNAEADSLRYDEVKQISIFTGNVVITKGTLIIRGDRVEVRQDNEGYQFGTAISTSGKRAFYRQKRDSVAGAGEEWMEGEGMTIVFDGKQDNVTFTKDATMRRLRGTTVTDEAQGDVITYDNTTDVFNVVGAPAVAGAPKGRVRAVLSPRVAASAPVPAAVPGGALRPSTTLGGDKK